MTTSRWSSLLVTASAVLLGTAAAAPAVGWQTLRVQSGKGPVCMLTHSDRVATPSNPTNWSFRTGPAELAIIENSIGIGDATIPGFTLIIDGQNLGTHAITELHYGPKDTPSVVKYVSAIAPVTDPATRQRILAALHPGSTIRLERRGTTFAAPLDETAATSFEACQRDLR